MKPIWASKTFWVNFLAFVGVFVVDRFIDPISWGELSVAILAVVNVILRLATHEGVSFDGSDN